MTFALTTLFAALCLAAVADWFSIIGFMAIYAAFPAHILIMGVILALAKLVTTSWVYRNWKFASWRLKGPLIFFVLALMVATSIGTFGFLSKAHLEQGASTIDNSAKIERLDQQITREKSVIADDEKIVTQLDATINSYLGKDRTDKSLTVRKSQAPQRKQLRDDIDASQKRIDGYSDERLKLQSEVRKQQLDVGPIRYIAELFYGVEADATKNIEAAVRLFTLLITSTLDPLAVILLIAANHTLLRIRDEKDEKYKDTDPIASTSGSPIAAITGPGQECNEGAPPVPEITPGQFSNELPNWEHIQPATTEGDKGEESTVSIPLLPEDLVQLNEIKSTAVEKAIAPIELSTRLGSTDSEQEALPSSGTTTLHREFEASNKSSAAKEIQEVIYEEENPRLEEESSAKIFTQYTPPPPIIRSPRLTRVRQLEESIPEIAELGSPLQEIDAKDILKITPHFIPQKVNEEEKFNQVESDKEDRSKESAPPPPPNLAVRAQEGASVSPSPPRENIEEISLQGSKTYQDSPPAAGSLYETENTSSRNKYPITLSWLAEFKRSKNG